MDKTKHCSSLKTSWRKFTKVFSEFGLLEVEANLDHQALKLPRLASNQETSMISSRSRSLLSTLVKYLIMAVKLVPLRIPCRVKRLKPARREKLRRRQKRALIHWMMLRQIWLLSSLRPRKSTKWFSMLAKAPTQLTSSPIWRSSTNKLRELVISWPSLNNTWK